MQMKVMTMILIVVHAFSSACTRGTTPRAEHVVVLVPSKIELPPGVSAEDFQRVLADAGRKWSYPAVSCTMLRIDVTPPAYQRRAVQDGQNIVVFRRSSWCHNERCGSESTFPFAAGAMTSVYPETAVPGQVTEGDIELNAVHFSWRQAGKSPSLSSGRQRQALLDAVLLHEIGHVLGFRDDAGSRGIMHASARTELDQEDIAAVCRAFPR
jgi:hypothetical protein